MTDKQEKGNKAEEMAAKMLEKKGYEILERNYTHGKGEIDIIVVKDDWLVFVEVRARSSTEFGFPEQTISKAKASLIKRTAENYIYENDWRGKVRFDIVGILVGQVFEIAHFEDAFY
jgi:putative endonuclease